MPNIKLYNGDCLEVLKDLINNKVVVNAIITDPPYNIARKNNFTSMGRSGIDFGEWDKGADLLSWIPLASSICDKNGSAFVFNAWKNLGEMSDCFEQNGFDTKDMFRFIKKNPMPRNRDRRYITDYECAFWCVKHGSKWVFNRQDEKYERPEFSCAIERNQVHPTQKPLELMEHIIKVHTNEGDTVLDPFMGSGTTGVACKHLNRNFIGIELDEKYFNIALERIKNG